VRDNRLFVNKFFKTPPNPIVLAMAAAYFSMAAFILTIGEKCYDWASRGLCEYPCQHGCDLALGMLEHGAFVSASLPDQIFTAWPPLYAFFVFPFFWAGDGHSLLLAVIVQAVLVFAVGLLLRRAVDMYFPGFGLLIMGLFIFNPNVFAIALVPKADTIFALTLALAFVSLLYYLKDGRGWRVALAGALIGVATLIRPTAQYLGVLLPIVIFLMVWVGPSSKGLLRALVHGLGGTALAIAVVFPWMIHLNNQGIGYRIMPPESEYIFLSDTIGTMEAHLAGFGYGDRHIILTDKFDAQLKSTIPNWDTLSDSEKARERVALGRSHLLSYPPREFIYPLGRSVVRFFVTGGEGYFFDLLKLNYEDQTATELVRLEESTPAIIAIKWISKGYAVLLRLLGLLGVIWLVQNKQYSVLVLCTAPVLYFMAITVFEGYSRFRLPVEVPLALLATFGVAYLLSWRNRTAVGPATR
jgi:4-amino-4-deoxy-L-arabinose transferase-like glycosyltransferase